MLDLSADYLLALASSGIKDLFALATLEGAGVPTQHLSLGSRTLTWGATSGLLGIGESLLADRETYVADDGAFGTKRDTLDTEPPLNTISFTNLDTDWYEAIHESGLDYNGVAITFKLVFAGVDPVAIEDSLISRIQDGPYLLSGGVMGDEGIEFEFGANFNALKLGVPALFSRARRCQFVYKGADGNCGSTSLLIGCGKTPSECAKRHNGVLRFSAWPFSVRDFV